MIFGPNKKPLRRILGFKASEVREDAHESGTCSTNEIKANYEPAWRGDHAQKIQPPFAKEDQ